MPDTTSEEQESNTPVLYYHFAGLTDTGMVRDHNEDAYKLPVETDSNRLANNGYLYVLADGMGGHQKGEVASAITTETINAEYYASTIPVPKHKPEQAIADALTDAIDRANDEVMDATQGGGTTVVAAVLHGDTLVSMNVGDSRAYLLRDNELRLISKDHSLVSRLVELGKITDEEASTHPRRNVLYQALGQGSDVEIHTVIERIKVNDIIILCSDGLWGEVSDPAIKEILHSASSPLLAAKQLIDLANDSGGADNITAIIIQISDREAPQAGYGSEGQVTQYTPSPDDTQPSLVARHQRPSTLPEGETQTDLD